MPSLPTNKNYISHLNINCLRSHKLIPSAQLYCSYISWPDLQSDGGRTLWTTEKGELAGVWGAGAIGDARWKPEHPPQMAGMEQRGATSQIPGPWKSLMLWRWSSIFNPSKSQEAILLALPTKCCLTNRHRLGFSLWTASRHSSEQCIVEPRHKVKQVQIMAAFKTIQHWVHSICQAQIN